MTQSAGVTAGLLMAMRGDEELAVAGDVSARLLAAVGRVQEIFRTWDPAGLAPVAVRAEGVTHEAGTARRGVACFFSGGVDSFYTLLKHRDEITHLIFIHGFDIKLENTALRERVAGTVRQVVRETGKQLIEVETNLRVLSEEVGLDWGRLYHGAALATVAHVLSPALRKVYVAATHTYADLFPWGSHPILDGLWSSERVELIHDGCEATRVQKVQSIVSSNVAMKTLRVCYRNKDGVYNCGRCEKCLRTMINLRVAGALQRCETFGRPLDLTAVSFLKVPDANTRSFVEENLRAVEAQGADPALARALRTALSQRYYRGAGNVARGFRNLYLNVTRRR